MKQEWAAKITCKENTTEPIKVYAEKLDNPSIETIKEYLANGFGIWVESALNRIICESGLVCDQAETGIGFATFRWHIASQVTAVVDCLERCNRTDIILYYDGKKLRSVSYQKAKEIAREYRRNIESQFRKN